MILSQKIKWDTLGQTETKHEEKQLRQLNALHWSGTLSKGTIQRQLHSRHQLCNETIP